MATFKICVFEHQKRKDGKFPVSIRVYWKGKNTFMTTEFYVTEKQINKKSFELKDIFIINELNSRIQKFEEIKSKKLGLKIEMYTSKELVKFFEDEIKHGNDSSINFVDFARLHMDKLKAKGKATTAKNHFRTINALIDFCNGREKIAITEITSKFLEQFEVYLRSERTMVRKNQFGRDVTTKKAGLSDVSIYDYMNDIRTIFNAAVDEYNDPDHDEVRISHYPFRKYKLVQRPVTKKRNLSKEQICAIRDIPDDLLPFDRSVFARDIFLLSFYLVGMNFADMYEVDSISNGRIEYNRKKTRGRRNDNAFISIKVEPEALSLIEKYKDKTGKRVFDFHTRYTESHSFSSNVNKGLKIVAEVCGVTEPLSTYYARHSWATIARNKCGISKDDVDLALNHIDQGHKMADVYIEKDWTLIDVANRKVLDYLLSLK